MHVLGLNGLLRSCLLIICGLLHTVTGLRILLPAVYLLAVRRLLRLCLLSGLSIYGLSHCRLLNALHIIGHTLHALHIILCGWHCRGLLRIEYLLSLTGLHERLLSLLTLTEIGIVIYGHAVAGVLA